jgi:hypothetical protein
MTTEYNSGSADSRFHLRLADTCAPAYDDIQCEPSASLPAHSSVGPEEQLRPGLDD